MHSLKSLLLYYMDSSKFLFIFAFFYQKFFYSDKKFKSINFTIIMSHKLQFANTIINALLSKNFIRD